MLNWLRPRSIPAADLGATLQRGFATLHAGDLDGALATLVLEDLEMHPTLSRALMGQGRSGRGNTVSALLGAWIVGLQRGSPGSLSPASLINTGRAEAACVILERAFGADSDALPEGSLFVHGTMHLRLHP
jgi:hypothetical protein